MSEEPLLLTRALTALERIAILEATVNQMAAQHAEMNGKLDRLLQAAAMGKGAWWIILRLGGTLAALGGLGSGAYSLWHLWSGR